MTEVYLAPHALHTHLFQSFCHKLPNVFSRSEKLRYFLEAVGMYRPILSYRDSWTQRLFGNMNSESWIFISLLTRAEIVKNVIVFFYLTIIIKHVLIYYNICANYTWHVNSLHIYFYSQTFFYTVFP